MASSTSAWMLSLKVLLMSTGAVSLAIALKVFVVPLVLQFSVSELPAIWRSFSGWLKPPYLYFIINGIIIGIVASSRFHQNQDEEEKEQAPPSKVRPVVYEMNARPREVPTVPEPRIAVVYEMNLPAQLQLAAPEELEPAYQVHIPSETQPVVVYEQSGGVDARIFEEKSVITEEKLDNSEMVVNDGDDSDEFVISRSSWMPPKRTPPSEIPSDFSIPAKPLVSARFGHRKPVKTSPEAGRALRVSKPKKHDTLENTWRMITEGKAKPLNRQYRKSDTWQNHDRQINISASNSRDFKKSETFKDRTNEQLTTPSPTPLKLRKEPSLSHDELNRRVEAFIKKFNEEMRLQRQESLDQYKQMINS